MPDVVAMRSRHLSLILHSLIFASCGPYAASVAATAEPDISYSACETALNHVHFDANATRLAETCESRLRHLSLYLCIRTHQTGDAWIDGLNTQNETCQKWLGVSLPPFDIIANYTDDDVAWLRKLSYEDRVNKISLNEVVAVSDRLYTIAYDTLVRGISPFCLLSRSLRAFHLRLTSIRMHGLMFVHITSIMGKMLSPLNQSAAACHDMPV